MTVGTFHQPNHEEIGLEGGDYKKDIDNSIAALARIGAAFAPHEQSAPDMTIRVDAGPVWVSGILTEKAAQDSAAITAPTTNPRIDRVVKDSLTGVIAVVTGTEAASPVAPDIPSGKEPICQIALETTTTAITNDMITPEQLPGQGANQSLLVGDVLQTTNVYANPAAVAAALKYGTWQSLMGYALFSIYPPTFTDETWVKSTGADGAWVASNPGLPLTGSGANGWTGGAVTNQRVHFDAGVAISLARIYYENYHESGTLTDRGAKNFTLWGSNFRTSFDNVTYAIDTGWTQLTTDISQFVQHVAADQADPHYVLVYPDQPYRYYAFKIADNWGNVNYIGVRRFELQLRQLAQWLRTA
jgi:hypothetical protein